MSDIFISYGRDDRPRVERLAVALEQRGWSVWWDRKIPTGEKFHREIAAALESAGCVIVVWSRASIRSEYVNEEARRAWSRNVLLPVRMDPVEPPFPFGGTQTLDLIGSNDVSAHAAFDQLVSDVERILAKRGAISGDSAPEDGLKRKPAGVVVDADDSAHGAEIAGRKRLIRVSGVVLGVAIAAAVVLTLHLRRDDDDDVASLDCPAVGSAAWETEERAAWPAPDDPVVLELGRCNALWNERTQGIATRTANAEALAAQTDCGMRRLEYVHRHEGQQWSDLTDEIAPLLHRALEAADGTRAADLLAHLGWADFLKSRDGIGGLQPDAYYRKAVEVDPDNPYANAMWGHWILWRNGPIAEARDRFSRALASGRERAFVRFLQLAALREVPVEEIRIADEMRRNGEPVPSNDPDRRVWSQYWNLYYFELFNPVHDSERDVFLAALAAADHLATFRWLFPVNQIPDSKRRLWVFFLATLQQRNGDRTAAQANFGWLCSQLAEEGASGGRLVEQTQAALQRNVRGHEF